MSVARLQKKSYQTCLWEKTDIDTSDEHISDSFPSYYCFTKAYAEQINPADIEDTEGIIIIRKSKDRQHHGQKKKDKRTSNELQNDIPKTKDLATQTQLKTGGELRCSGRVSSSCSIIYGSKCTRS